MKALEAALSRRGPCLDRLAAEGTDAYRLFCGEGEGIAGLVADRFGPVVVLQWHEGKCRLGDAELRDIAAWYLGELPVTAVYLKRFIADRSRALAEDAMYSPAPLAGNASPAEILAREYGLSFVIRPYSGFSTGLFLDQRENRRFLATLGARDALNAFSYTCGFSVSLARAGAKVTSVDLSRKWLEWGKENFAANQLPTESHAFIADDIFPFLKRAAKKGQAYDLVVLDPPSFSRGKAGVFSVKKDLARLLEAARPVVRPGGKIFFSTNYAEWTTADLERRMAGFGGKLLTLPPTPEDFAPQGGGLSAVLLELP